MRFFICKTHWLTAVSWYGWCIVLYLPCSCFFCCSSRGPSLAYLSLMSSVTLQIFFFTLHVFLFLPISLVLFFFFLSVLFTSPLFFQRLLKLYFSTGLGFITGLKPQQIHKDTSPAVFGSCMSPQGRWGGRRGVMWWGWSSRRPLDTGRKTLKAELNLSTNVVIILIGLAVLVPQVT